MSAFEPLTCQSKQQEHQESTLCRQQQKQSAWQLPRFDIHERYMAACTYMVERYGGPYILPMKYCDQGARIARPCLCLLLCMQLKNPKMVCMNLTLALDERVGEQDPTPKTVMFNIVKVEKAESFCSIVEQATPK